MNLNDYRIAFNFMDSSNYPVDLPFDPPERYPEYRGRSTNPDNHIYCGVRTLFHDLGLDRSHFNTRNWNPLGDIIEPGMVVFIKPNMVAHQHPENKNIFSIVTHGSVVRPILDYVCKALQGEGKIVIGDSQYIFSDFSKAMTVSYIRGLLEWYGDQTNIPIECLDLRSNKGVRTYLYGKWGRQKVEADKSGYRFVDLGDFSWFTGIDPKRLRIAVASHKNMVQHHSNGKHEYLFPKSFLDSDTIISVPKLKTHRRTALTLAIKNFMGIPSLKDSLPHFMIDSLAEGGDQYIYPSLRKRVCTKLDDQIQSNPYLLVKALSAAIKKIIWNSHKIIPFKDDIIEGRWYGNDTLWRTLLDLNRAAFFADKSGKISAVQQREHLCVVDGIIAGEKNGPLAPDPVSAGVLLAGFNPLAVDAAGATLIGFDIEKIPHIKKGIEENNGLPPIFAGKKEDVQILNGNKILDLRQLALQKWFRFEPHPNWKGHVEL